MEKSCEISGKYFQTNKSNRKYCDDCSPKSDKLKIRMKMAIKESKERMKEPEVITRTCHNCGKPLIDVDYYDPGPGKVYIKNQFFSDKCVAEYREKAAERRKKRKCAFCGKEYTGQGAF